MVLYVLCPVQHSTVTRLNKVIMSQIQQNSRLVELMVLVNNTLIFDPNCEQTVHLRYSHSQFLIISFSQISKS